MYRIYTAFLLLVIATSGSLLAQESTSLSVGTLIEHDLVTDSKDVFDIELESEMFVFGYVDQISVDVIVTILDPTGKKLRSLDGPGRGPEYFQFNSDDAGTYQIVVTPFEDETGNYSILVEHVDPMATEAQDRVDQLMVRYDRDTSPGVVVAIVERDEITFQKAYGMANLSHGIPFSTETVTNIGSTSKQFTAMGIMLLANEGKLSLDDDVRIHIPELPDLGHVVTVRNLLTHTTGYREFLNLLSMGGRVLGEGDHIDREELIEIVQRQPELQNEPGAEWNYNNTSFGLLAVIIERISGDSFPNWMAENVFRPAGMNNTMVRAHVGEIIPNSAQGYVPTEEVGVREARDISASMGAGGIYTTVADLAKWMRNYHTADVGGRAVIDAMTTPFVLTSGDTTGYGFGLFIDEVRGLKRFHHGGADTAHRSTFVYYPELESGYIVQSNHASFDGSIGGEIADAFFGDYMTEEEDDIPDEAPTDFDPESYNPEDFDVFAGRYELEEAPGFILTFSRRDEEFFTQGTGQPEFPIFPASDSTFVLRVVEASITFHRDSDGKVTSATFHQNGNHLAKRLDDETAAPDLSEFIGRYFSEELETYYDIVLEDSSLVIQHRRLDNIKLNHTKENLFSGGFPIGTVEFERSEDGAVTGLKAGNARTRDVWFDKLN